MAGLGAPDPDLAPGLARLFMEDAVAAEPCILLLLPVLDWFVATVGGLEDALLVPVATTLAVSPLLLSGPFTLLFTFKSLFKESRNCWLKFFFESNCCCDSFFTVFSGAAFEAPLTDLSLVSSSASSFFASVEASCSF